MGEEFVTIARVVKPQGRRGEVAADLHTDFPELFAQRKRVSLRDAAGRRQELEIQEFWPHKGRVVLKFAGVDSISEAEALVGGEVQIPRAQRAALEPGAAYVSDLVGCEVLASGRTVGTITEVQFGAGEAPLLIVRDGRREQMIPFAEAFVEAVELDARRIRMKLPEGMLDLDAPLTAEEKLAQRKGRS